MGLLDDAIREHLELKRLRGADLGEVAREEHEALGSAPTAVHDEPVGAPDGDAEASDRGAPAWDFDEPSAETHERAANHESASNQETAELDMQMVLGADPSHPIRAARSGSDEDYSDTHAPPEDPGDERIDRETPAEPDS